MIIVSYQNCSAPFEVAKDFGSRASGSTGLSTPAAIPHKARVFVAGGHVGRTVMSCDGGKTWIHDQSVNDATRCWTTGDPNNLECDHQPTAGRGVAISGGAVYVNNGWGFNGTLRRSTDAATWTTLRSDGCGPGVEAFGSQLILLWSGWQTSADAGTTWQPVQNSPSASIGHATIHKVGDQVFTFGDGGSAALSNDHGLTWQLPTGLNASVTSDVASSGTRLVAIGQTFTQPPVPYVSISDDNGKTWTATQFTDSHWSWGWQRIIYDGTQFMTWTNGGYRYTSPDGVTWDAKPITFTSPPKSSMQGLVNYDPVQKVFVSISNNWGAFYANQYAYRSTDGLSWTELDSTSFHGGHPISTIISGEIMTTDCP